MNVKKKLRMLSVLKLSLPINNRTIELKNLKETNWDEMTREQELHVYKFNIDVTEDDVNQCKEVLPVILYLAGYCCHAVFKKLKCNSCKNLISGREAVEEIAELNSYFQGINRGSLLYPNDITNNFVLYNYIVINKLTKCDSFLHSIHQRKLAMYITLNILADQNRLFHVDSCDEGHTIQQIEKMLIWSSSNSLINNFCRKENDNISKKKNIRKRKIQTFN